ncbi:dynamin family protein [Skeletonema marinoi]|uniref:Dynamin family protein n=1 Tax=Skeletonema marinoi TaxID=267567 RepID=A0AAD9DG19_9STRA|nr:dynamin family protein [Skeletonema marinoi]
MTERLAGYEDYHSFMDKLTEAGVDDYIDLPMIAVMGDTSSGKSSLLSNISLIELPSADVLTTRCPIMLKMHYSKHKSASVKISWKDDPIGKEEFAERTIGEDNWESITNAISAAQAHIIKMSGKDVARDIVSVDIRGPHCEDLTLIDLPGIVRTTGKNESATLAEDIQGLMNDYLKNPRCVILAVLPCNVDFHNSQIMADARKVDPSTERTIPVLTKPDLIDKGGERSVKDLLLGSKTQSFECGFHMAKGRGQEALDKKQSIEDGLTAEESYFQNTEPWRGVEDKNLFGTKNLRVKLAELQMKLIQSSFMSIVSDLKSQRDESLELLTSLGAIPSTLTDKKALFRGIKEEIWSGMGSQTLDGRICSLHNDTEMRPSAQFLDASTRYQTTLSKSKLANISEVVVGRKAISYDKDKEKYDHGTVCFIDQSEGKVYLEEFAYEEERQDRLSLL